MYLFSKFRESCTSIIILNLDSILHTIVKMFFVTPYMYIQLVQLYINYLYTKGSSKIDNNQFLHNDIHAFLETNKTLKNEIQYDLKQK